MPKAEHLIDAAAREREDGVVFLDPGRAAGPAAHVLIVGVAAYDAPKYARLLDTATISARRTADWFLADGAGGFKNPECGLGSLAILLSETHDGARADYAGGPVPRASFAATKNAVEKWLDRVETHRDNLAILYVASHGESFQSRTAFLLEDYGTARRNATAGMADVEQFITSMNNAVPIRQLMIFDCCRGPTDVALPWDEPLGDKLISLTKGGPNDHGIPRKQWVVCSTTLGEVAYGRKQLPTLFNDALIDALDGVAGDTSEPDWPVKPGALFDRIDRILSLHRLSAEEKPQTPAGRMAGSFDITLPGETQDVTVYVGVEDPADWPGSTIILSRPGAADITVDGLAGQSPFFKERLPAFCAITAAIRRNGLTLGSVDGKVRMPVTFVEIGRTPPPAPIVVGTLPSGATAAAADAVAAGRLEIRVDGPTYVEAAATLDVVRRNGAAEPARHFVVAIGGTTIVDAAAGDHALTLRTPDGVVRTRDVTVDPGAIVAVVFEGARSPHEWLATAALSGAIGAPAEPPKEAPAASPPPAPPPGGHTLESILKTLPGISGSILGFDTRRLSRIDRLSFDADRAAAPDPADRATAPEPAGAEPPGPPPVYADVVGGYGVDLTPRGPGGDLELSLTQDLDDGRFVRIGVVDHTPSRWPHAPGLLEGAPIFAEITVADRREIAVVPTIGAYHSGGSSDWRPHLVVDRLAPATRPLTTALVEDQRWSGLLGFLGARDMVSGARLLDRDLERHVIDAIRGKLVNPLAAAAGALIAVAVADPKTDAIWDPWLRNLATWFPAIPDGAIIFGWRLLNRARSADELAEARAWLADGHQRGIPVYSLAVDWLARGLESLPGEDADLVAMQRSARRLANRVDSTRTFTVVRLPR